jgi:hypothetical protein
MSTTPPDPSSTPPPPPTPSPPPAPPTPSTPPAPPTTTTATTPVRTRNGMGVASLVIGVASLVAVASFVLFPVGLVASIVGLVLGLIALTRGRDRGATNHGHAIAGVVCCVLALVGALTLTVRVGTWAARNTNAFTNFDKCIAQANDRAEVADCIAGFARDVRP